MKNNKKIELALDEVMKELISMPSEQFKKELYAERDLDIGNILVEGGFICSERTILPNVRQFG
jgi:hypothetical protein